MSKDQKQDPKAISRRETLKLASAVSALGVGLGASLASSTASADGSPPIHQVKIDTLKIDGLVLSIHKTSIDSPPLHAVDVTALVTQAQKWSPGAYYLKLTSLKQGAPVAVAVDTLFIK